MAATDKLAGYRNDPKASPQPVEDAIGAPAAVPHEGEDAARKAALAPPAAVPLVTGDRTPAFVDRQRQALAERFKAERAAERKTLVPASHVPFIDGDNPAIPGALPVEDDTQPDDPDTAAHEKERREAEEAALAAATTEPKEPDKPKTYSLKVDGNQFTVSREELLRYAEIDAADAEQFSEPSLVRLAQKQIAASNRLAEANALKDQARRTQQPEPAPRPAPTPSPARTPDPALVNAIEKIQLGDPEEAARALQAVFDAGVNHALRENDQVHAFGGVQAEYAAGIDAFTTQHPDVIANPVLSSAHIALVAREIADDIHALGLVDEAQYSAIATNPKLAADVLTAARAERRQVRTPNAIFEAAFDKLAAIAGIPKTTEAPAPAPTPRVAVSRIAEKRALLPPLARTGISQMGSAEPTPTPEDRIAVASAAIQKMRKARFQPTS